MSESPGGAAEVPTHPHRCLGRRGTGAGPTVIAMTGMHGNEPAGVLAAERVIARIDAERREPAGTFVAFVGNLKALAERTRFLDKDLNRMWTPARVASLDDPAVADAEAAEQRELLAAIREHADGCRGPVYFFDLHTTSAVSAPFVTVGDTLRNRSLARSFPLPLILGLEEQVDGALLEYLNNFGLITVGAEAGQHDCDGSVDRLEALLWLALERTGLCALSDGERGRHTAVLREASAGVPRVVEVRYRHAITDEDRFRMKPGFDNFVPVRKGEVVAHDRNGEVRAPEDGLMLLPLYQGKGEDGFFIARPVRMFWLRLSRFLRRRGFAALLPWLPGVRRDRDHPLRLIVDTRVARWYPLEIFHLFGYRKLRQLGAALVVTRRAFDFEGPDRIRV